MQGTGCSLPSGLCAAHGGARPGQQLPQLLAPASGHAPVGAALQSMLRGLYLASSGWRYGARGLIRDPAPDLKGRHQAVSAQQAVLTRCFHSPDLQRSAAVVTPFVPAQLCSAINCQQLLKAPQRSGPCFCGESNWQWVRHSRSSNPTCAR
jgi:hypothetical protein